jgi:hypothetical protein
MKALVQFAFLALLMFAFAPIIRAQDDNSGPPPDSGAPPPDSGAPPPDSGAPAPDSDDQGVSFQNFYDQLGSQGNWVQTDDYGYVFQPNVSDPNWAPYTNGHWAYTDQGWTWMSDEPWGWATDHYGRWANINGTGWVWVPGYRWAPAWVSWRYGGGYAGWAPLPPESFVGAEYGNPGGVNVGIGFHFGGDVEVTLGIGAGCYNFLAVGDMGEPNYRGRFIDRSRNYTVINNTTNITNINVNKTVINNYGGAGASGSFRGVAAGGPPINEVNAQSRVHIPTVRLTAAGQPGRSRLQGHSLAVYAPRVNPASAKQARPARVASTIAHPTFNRGVSITKPLAVNANLRPPAPSAAAIEAARTAQEHAPANAHIATSSTTLKRSLRKPLTSMTPVTQMRKPTSATSTHTSAGSSSTGEREPRAETETKPTSTYHPETETKPTSTYHPETETKPTSTYHPETETKPTSTYHPQEQNGGGSQNHSAPPTHSAPAANHPAPAGAGKPGNNQSGNNNNRQQGQ